MSRDPNRETIRLRAWKEIPPKYRVGFVNGNLVGITPAQSFTRAIRFMRIADRYVDTLTHRDMDKVAVLNMAEPNTYIEGVGIYVEVVADLWEMDETAYPKTERVYLIHA